MQKSQKRTRLAFADGLRGIAALWVVLFHMAEGSHIQHIKVLLPHSLYQLIFEVGHLGVAIFFVLSGYVMALTASNTNFNWVNSYKFILRRITRLTPPYYFAIAFATCAFAFKGSFLKEPVDFPSLSTVLQHLVFLQGIFESPQINIVFWTLCIEIQFYLVFAFLIYISDSLKSKLLPDYNIRYITFCVAASIALLWPIRFLETPIWPGGFIGFWYSFLAGAIACWSWKEKGKLLLFSILYTSLLFIIGASLNNQFIITVATTSSLLLLASYQDSMGKWLNWKWLQWLGLISYSLYLLHNPITGASFRFINKLTGTSSLLNDFVGMLFCLVTSLSFAYIAYLIVEKPSIRMSQHFKTKG